MPNLVTLAVILPLLGAGVTLLASVLPHQWPWRPLLAVLRTKKAGSKEWGPGDVSRYACYIALAVAASSTTTILVLGQRGPVTIALPLWRPSQLLGSVLVLRSDAFTFPLALALALATFGAILVGLSRAGETSPVLAAAALAMLAAGLASLWAGNLLTLLICWPLYDLFKIVGCISAGGARRTALRDLIFGGLATLLLWMGAVLTGDATGDVLWSLTTLDDVRTGLWAWAGILRLSIYPLHLLTPDELDTASPLAVSFYLSPVVGWGLWLRLVSAGGGSLPARTWVMIAALVSWALGGFLAWSAKSFRRSSPWIGVGVNGGVLLAAGLAEEAVSAIVAAGSVTWMLGMTVLLLGSSMKDHPWWGIPSLVGGLALVGVPLTLGGMTAAALVKGLVEGIPLWWMGAFSVGQVFLAAALARWLLSSTSVDEGGVQGVRAVARGVGLGALALLLVAGGLYPKLIIQDPSVPSLGALLAKPGLIGWLLWGIPLAVGGALVWQEESVRPKIELGISALHDLLRLEWLYELLVGALERGLGVLRAVDEVMGGAGALLWSWVLFLVLLLVWSGG